MTFASLIEQLHRSEGRSVSIPAEWAQGRATFGGLVAALVYEAMRMRVPSERELRSLSVSFVGPVAPEEMRVEVQVLRAGKSVTQVQGTAYQGDAVMAVLLGSFGGGRESGLRVDAEPAPVLTPAESCRRVPFVPGRSPAFTRFFETRWATGEAPFSRSQVREIGGWVRLDEPAQPITEAALLALVDAWPPTVLPMMAAPAPSSSLAWTIEFVHPLPRATSSDWWMYHAIAEHARDGYAHCRAGLWTPDGELVAISRQTYAVFG